MRFFRLKGGGRRRRLFLATLVVSIGAIGAFLVSNALAVHDLAFQLDGDVSLACPPNNALPLCSSSQTDWGDLTSPPTGHAIFNVTDDTTTSPGTETVAPNALVVNPINNPGFTFAAFQRDFASGADCTLTSLGTKFCTGDATTFATGSKDTLDITGWQCNFDSNVNSKIDIMNAYSVAYKAANGDKILYFGMEKNKNNGTNDVGFWFLHGDANCSAPSGHKTWSGQHSIGDVLVVSEFTAGGGVSTITAYEWVGGSNPLTEIASATNADCKNLASTTPTDKICATTNSGSKPFNGNIQTPWLTADATLGVGHTVVPPDFFEGGIDLTQVFGNAAPPCFNTFIADTRSSASLTATLFDYARGRLGECQSPTQTTPVDSSGTAESSITLGSTIYDKAVVTGVAGVGTPTGTVSFSVCGPIATGTCTSDGTSLGTKTLTAIANSDPPAATATSDGFTPTVVGRYCFRGDYSGDNNYQPSSDSSSGECFTVTDTTSTQSTQNWLPNDSGTVSSVNGANLTGTLTMQLYTGDNCGATSGSAVSGQSYQTTLDGTTTSGTVTSNNTSYKVTASTSVSWLVTFSSTDTNVTGSSRCEKTSLTITN